MHKITLLESSLRKNLSFLVINKHLSESDMMRKGQKKALLMVRRAFNMLINIVKLKSDLSSPPSAGWSWHLTHSDGFSMNRLSRLQRAIPSAFLDKRCKRTGTKIKTLCGYFQII